MYRVILIAAAALGLSACAMAPSGSVASPGATAPVPVTSPTPVASTVDKAAEAAARADVAVDRAWTAYVAIRNVAELVVPFLSPTRAANVRAIEATVERAFARARAATDLAVKAAELANAAQAAASLEALTTDPD